MTVRKESEEITTSIIENKSSEHEAWYSNGIWQAPKLVRGIDFDKDPNESVETNWSELFLDLIVVSIVSKMGSALRKEINHEEINEDGLDLKSYCFYFITLYQIWVNAVYYNTRFGGNDLSHKLILAGFMLSMVMASFHVTSNLSSDKATGFFSAIACVSILISVIHMRVAKEFWNHPSSKRPRNFGIVYGIKAAISAGLIWIASIPSVVPSSNRWIFIILFLIVENPQLFIFTLFPLQTRNKILSAYLIPYTIEHITERYGLITMIVIGEGIDCLTEEVGNNVYSTRFVAYITMVFITLFCIKLAYFDSVADIGSIDDHPMRIHALAGLMYTYGHYVTSMAIALFGTAITLTTEDIFGQKEDRNKSENVEGIDVKDEDFSVSLAYYAGSSAAIFFVFTVLSLLKVERLPNRDVYRKLHINIYIFEHVGGFLISFILAVISMQFTSLPQVSNMKLVFLNMCFCVTTIMIDFGNKWCLAESSSWGENLIYIWNLLPFIRAKLKEHPLARHPTNNHLHETASSAVGENTPLL